MPTAGVVIIGNEILTGKFADENGPYLIGRLRTLGVDLRRLCVVADDREAIADEVRRCALAYDHVFTTGGVGPTHDDVTLEAIAAAFSVPLERREELVERLRHFGLPEDEANLRMATVPVGTELLAHEALAYPVLRVRNVYVMPGVPRLLQAKFEAIAPAFAADEVSSERVFVDEAETAIASRLTALAARHPGVDIGSYPRFGEARYRVILTLESRDPTALAAARHEILDTFQVVILD